MRRYFFFVLLFVGARQAMPQSQQVDSLREAMLKSKGTAKVDALNTLAHEISSYNYDQSVQLAGEAFVLAKELNYTNGMAEARLYEGVIALRIGKNELAQQKFLECIELCKTPEVQYLKGGAFTYLGVLHQDKDRLDSAEFYYKKSYQLLEDGKKPLYLSFLYRNLARLSQLKNDIPQQLNYLNKSWLIRKELKDKRPMVHVGKDLVVYYTEQGDYRKSLSLLEEIQKALGRDTIGNEEISLIYKERAIIYADLGDYKTALSLFYKVRKFYEQNESQYELANLFGDMGNVLSFSSSNYETSLKYFFKAIDIAELNLFHSKTTMLYARVGWVYFLMEQYKLAEEYSQKALKTAEGKYPSEEASALNMLGLLNTRYGNNQRALDYLERALVIRQKNNYRAAEASTLLNIGIVYEQMNNLKMAEQYDLKSLALEEELNNASDLSYAYQSLGQLYTKMKLFDKALLFLNKGEILAKKIRAKDIVKDVYKNKRDLFGAQLNYAQAYRYAVLYQQTHDSLFNENLSTRISAIQYDFELDQKEDQIKILNQQQQLQQDRLARQQDEIRFQRWTIIIGIVFLIIVSAVAYSIFFYYKKVRKLNFEVAEQNEEITAQSEELREANEVLGKLNREVTEQNEEIQSQAEELTESNQAIAKINEGLEEKIRARTNELKTAYRELDTFFYRSSHDFRRPLTTFMGLAEVAKIMVKEPASLELFEKVNETARNLDKMLMKLQSVSLVSNEELSIAEIDFNDIFQRVVHQFQSDLVQRKIRTVLKVELKNIFYSYPILIETALQNIIENAVLFCAHQNPVIELSATTSGNEVNIVVADNGQGIDRAFLPRVSEMYFRANEKSTGNGLGLYIVKKMVDRLQGRLIVDSELNKGTTVSIFLPNRAGYIFK
ncbi:MAG: tetratricopeptide repeat-containing sensor histidine kinase [Bacteroidetes bacterium]|nr:tetratricopeptide repeat-containing sensor histidine kinase [Bacteroidota bacterium]